MIAEFEAQIIAALHSIFDQFGWFGLAGLMAFENATSLTTNELPLGLARLTLLDVHVASPAMVLVVGLLAALGNQAVSSITYWLVRFGGRPLPVQITAGFVWIPTTSSIRKHYSKGGNRC